MTHSPGNTHRNAATIAWTATKAEAYNEPPFAHDAFCIQFVVLNGDHHIYRLNRENLTKLFARISDMLGETATSIESDLPIAA